MPQITFCCVNHHKHHHPLILISINRRAWCCCLCRDNLVRCGSHKIQWTFSISSVTLGHFAWLHKVLGDTSFMSLISAEQQTPRCAFDEDILALRQNSSKAAALMKAIKIPSTVLVWLTSLTGEVREGETHQTHRAVRFGCRRVSLQARMCRSVVVSTFQSSFTRSKRHYIQKIFKPWLRRKNNFWAKTVSSGDVLSWEKI